MNLSPLFGSQTFVFLPSSLSTRPQQWVLALSPFSLFQYSRNARSKGAFGLRSDPSPHSESSEAPLMRCSQNIEVSDCSERERVVISATECVDLSTEGLVRYPLVLMGHPLVSPHSSPRQMYVRCKCELYMFRKTLTWNGIEKRVNGSSWIVLLAYLDCVFPASMLTIQT